MSSMYGHKWSSAYGPKDVDNTWAIGLGDMTAREIGQGLRACLERNDAWPPSLPEFRMLCRPTIQKRENEAMYRLPPSRQLPHLLSDERRASGRQGIALAKAQLRGAANG